MVDIRSGELVESIHVPPPQDRTGSAYLRLSARSKVDMAAVGVAARLVLDEGGAVSTARLALTAVAPTPLRCPEAEKLLVGNAPDTDLFVRCAESCARAAKPIDDVRASAAYRRSLVYVLAKRVLAACVETIEGRMR
jgi:carbon-monoxide dehydrogenase medium subunit